MPKKLQIVSGRPFQADWNIDDEDNMAFIRNKPAIKMKNIILYTSSWSDDAPYSQQVTIDVTPNSKIDIQPSVDIVTLGIHLLIKNDNGIVTAYAINDKPGIDLNLQVTVTEIVKENVLDVIWGNAI